MITAVVPTSLEATAKTPMKSMLPMQHLNYKSYKAIEVNWSRSVVG